eukprot:c22227_g1_i1 orf=126-998(+)
MLCHHHHSQLAAGCFSVLLLPGGLGFLPSPPRRCLLLSPLRLQIGSREIPPLVYSICSWQSTFAASLRLANYGDGGFSRLSNGCSAASVGWTCGRRMGRLGFVGRLLPRKVKQGSFFMCIYGSSYVGNSIPEAYGVTESGRFTISDEDLLSRGFQLHRSTQNMDLEQLNNLFVKVGFPRRQKQKLERALQHTSSLLWLQEIKSERLIAFARATGDDVFNAIIWDVVVDPAFQGLGLGKVVMERLMVDLVRKGVSNICLYAEPDVVGFYRPLGFVCDPDNIRAMAYSKRGS